MEEDPWVEVTEEQMKEWDEKDKMIEESIRAAKAKIEELKKSNEGKDEEIKQITDMIRELENSVRYSKPRAPPRTVNSPVESVILTISNPKSQIQEKSFTNRMLSTFMDKFYAKGVPPDPSDNLYHTRSNKGNITVGLLNGMSHIGAINFVPLPGKDCAVKTISVAFIKGTELVGVYNNLKHTFGNDSISNPLILPYSIECDTVKIIVESNWGSEDDVCFKAPVLYQ